MIDPAQIHQKAKQRYPAFLNSIIAGESLFPIEFPIGTLPKEYLSLREAAMQLISKSKQGLGYGYDVELETRKTQKYGLQSLPRRIRFDTEQDYLRFLKKENEVAQFRANIDLIRSTIPELQNWLSCNASEVIKFGDRWNELLKVCQYFQKNPKPNLYIRELPIQVHTKFIEQNQRIIRSLLEAILPVNQLAPIEGEKEYIFEKRFSLKYREPGIRFRILDHSLKSKYSFPATDMSIPNSEFRQLNLDAHRCFITENLMNFLTLPSLKNSFAIFGSGYAVQNLKGIPWLLKCPIFYWGDLDADGFKILSQLRSYFPQTNSIMMDIFTFRSFCEFVVPVEGATVEALPYLTPEESTLYTHISSHQKRLEQEHISQNYVNQFLQNLE